MCLCFCVPQAMTIYTNLTKKNAEIMSIDEFSDQSSPDGPSEAGDQETLTGDVKATSKDSTGQTASK